MLKLNAVKLEKIWGYELWLASTHQIACQDDFKEICRGDYPLLVKVIQANDKLSIQVHPDDDCAVKLEGAGNRGKTECWYVLDAEENSKIVYGIKNGFSKEVLAKAISENKLEQYLEFVNVKKGDFIYIPAGTVHAICSGLRLLEVQQSCDLTYRLYDWGRGREVHLEKALAVIKCEKTTPVSQFAGEFNCKYFSLKKIDVNGGWSMLAPERDFPAAVQLLFVISCEKAVIRTSDEKVGKQLSPEDTYAVLPGEKITVEGKASIMKITAS